MFQSVESQVHSAFDGRLLADESVFPLKVGRDFEVSDFAALKKLGIGLDVGIVRDMIAMDTIQQGITTPTIPSLVQFLQNWLPGFVWTITAARKIDEILGIDTTGSWEDEQIVQSVMEYTGSAVPYTDLGNVPLVDWNPQYVSRTVIRFEQGMRVGNLEEARSARVRVNSAEVKRKTAAMTLEIQRNLIGFYGYNSGNNNTYGFLNDPNFPSWNQVADGANGYTWSVKTFLEITADFRTAFQKLRTQSQDVISPDSTPITCAVPTNAIDYLTVVTDFGISVWDWLKQTYPKTRIVSAPQLNTAHANEGGFVMFADRVNDGASTDNEKTWAQIVPAKFQVVGVQKLVKGYEEDYTNATAGALLKRPYAVVAYYGIS